jgi:hypothetical protein
VFDSLYSLLKILSHLFLFAYYSNYDLLINFEKDFDYVIILFYKFVLFDNNSRSSVKLSVFIKLCIPWSKFICSDDIKSCNDNYYC